MQKVEPTGLARLEWYLAKLVSIMKNAWGDPGTWPKELIGYEEPQQSAEQILAAFEQFERQFNGDDFQS